MSEGDVRREVREGRRRRLTAFLSCVEVDIRGVTTLFQRASRRGAGVEEEKICER
jgi:hypothetical protein